MPLMIFALRRVHTFYITRIHAGSYRFASLLLKRRHSHYAPLGNRSSTLFHRSSTVEFDLTCVQQASSPQGITFQLRPPVYIGPRQPCLRIVGTCCSLTSLTDGGLFCRCALNSSFTMSQCIIFALDTEALGVLPSPHFLQEYISSSPHYGGATATLLGSLTRTCLAHQGSPPIGPFTLTPSHPSSVRTPKSGPFARLCPSYRYCFKSHTD